MGFPSEKRDIKVCAPCRRLWRRANGILLFVSMAIGGAIAVIGRARLLMMERGIGEVCRFTEVEVCLLD